MPCVKGSGTCAQIQAGDTALRTLGGPGRLVNVEYRTCTPNRLHSPQIHCIGVHVFEGDTSRRA